MRLSVIIPTYNHENFISQAVDSVLMQKTSFDLEILIGEDDSDDNTRRIVQEFQKRHPKKIKLFLNDRKNVIFIDGHATGKWNSMNLIRNASGKYIAILEGDDFWTDPLKLQKQVDFLEKNRNFVLCCHNSRLLFVDNPTLVRHIRPDLSSFAKEELSIEDQIENACSFHTASVVFRNGLLELPDFYKEVASGDIALFTMLAQFGKIKYLDEVMSVYRVHDGGISRYYDKNDNL